MTLNSPEALRTVPRSGKHVLLVEDNLAANRGLTRLLEARGYKVSSAVNGNEAIEFLESGSPPEIVLADLQLPDMDGRDVVEFASELRPRPRIGAITAWDVDPKSDLRLAEQSDWIMRKPLDLSELFARLSEMSSLLDLTDFSPKDVAD